jgi:hypothetical protein
LTRLYNQTKVAINVSAWGDRNRDSPHPPRAGTENGTVAGSTCAYWRCRPAGLVC